MPREEQILQAAAGSIADAPSTEEMENRVNAAAAEAMGQELATGFFSGNWKVEKRAIKEDLANVAIAALEKADLSNETETTKALIIAVTALARATKDDFWDKAFDRVAQNFAKLVNGIVHAVKDAKKAIVAYWDLPRAVKIDRIMAPLKRMYRAIATPVKAACQSMAATYREAKKSMTTSYREAKNSMTVAYEEKAAKFERSRSTAKGVRHALHAMHKATMGDNPEEKSRADRQFKTREDRLRAKADIKYLERLNKTAESEDARTFANHMKGYEVKGGSSKHSQLSSEGRAAKLQQAKDKLKNLQGKGGRT